ncbi:MAG: bis(5'-nucleosyl)-tetraphosphatase (symmetrical) YqeK [Sphaerochaeta sp.]|jgi:predicted HD superfamily hydrolase involved in NAD metabolism|nr:HD domain-containing protein [Spirochaetales bacterium]
MKTISIDLERCLSSERLRHSKAVAQTAMLLNHTYALGLDDQELGIAGLYHDLAREWKDQELLEYTHTKKIEVTPDELANPTLLHGPVAAHLMQATGPSDEVLLAIRHHTLGSVEMGSLGLLIYLADYLEPNRTHITEDVRLRLLGLQPVEALAMAVIDDGRAWQPDGLLEPTKILYRSLKEGLGR